MDRLQEMLPRAEAYLSARHWGDVPVMARRTFRVLPLAQGEYNLNYLLTGEGTQLVLRVNIGTQIGREDQILYEYNALRLLESSGVTPTPYFADDTRAHIDRGILIMAYLPGEPLDYEHDVEAAAELLAIVHQVPVAEEENHLIREDAPLSLIYQECARLLETYFASPLADPDIKAYLQTVKAWADAARVRERFFQEDPWPCIVNTEVNSAPGGLGNATLRRPLSGPVPLLFTADDPVEDSLPDAGEGEAGLPPELRQPSPRPAPEGHHRGSRSGPRSVRLSARHFLVRHGMGGLPDGLRRGQKSGHLGHA
jgi:hypothetical protein